MYGILKRDLKSIVGKKKRIFKNIHCIAKHTIVISHILSFTKKIIVMKKIQNLFIVIHPVFKKSQYFLSILRPLLNL